MRWPFLRRSSVLSLVALSSVLALSSCGAGVDPCPSVAKQGQLTRCSVELRRTRQGWVMEKGALLRFSGADLKSVQGCQVLTDGVYVDSVDGGDPCGIVVNDGEPSEEKHGVPVCVSGFPC